MIYDLRLRPGDVKGPYRVLSVRDSEEAFGYALNYELEATTGERGHFQAVSSAMIRSLLEHRPRAGDRVEFYREANTPRHRVEGVRILERAG